MLEWFFVIDSEGIAYRDKDGHYLQEYVEELVEGNKKKMYEYFDNEVEFIQTTEEELKQQKYKIWRK